VGAEAVDLKNVKNPTPADKLLAEFDINPDISYIALIAEFNTDKLTNKMKRTRKGEHYFEDVEALQAHSKTTVGVLPKQQS
jgi:hypothetical protein